MPDDILQQIEEFGGLQLDSEEVAIIIDKQTGLWTEKEWAAYKRGHLKAEAEVRKAMKRLAIQGSSPAQSAFMDLARARTHRENARNTRK